MGIFAPFFFANEHLNMRQNERKTHVTMTDRKVFMLLFSL